MFVFVEPLLQPTYADFAMANMIATLHGALHCSTMIGARAMGLEDLRKRVENLPGVKEYLASDVAVKSRQR
jgi:hypothetical protein